MIQTASGIAKSAKEAACLNFLKENALLQTLTQSGDIMSQQNNSTDSSSAITINAEPAESNKTQKAATEATLDLAEEMALAMKN